MSSRAAASTAQARLDAQQMGARTMPRFLASSLLIRGLASISARVRAGSAGAQQGSWCAVCRAHQTKAHLPGVEVQAGELAEVDVRHVDVERLALVDEGAPVGGHVHQHPLLDLPHRLVQRLQVVRDVQVLDKKCEFRF